MAKRKKVPYIARDIAVQLPLGQTISRDIIERARREILQAEDNAVFAALDNAANFAPIDEQGEAEAAVDEVEEIPPPLAPVEPERVIIHAQNGNDLYWNAAQNRWLIVGVPEEDQPAPPPRLQATQAAYRFRELVPERVERVIGRVDALPDVMYPPDPLAPAPVDEPAPLYERQVQFNAAVRDAKKIKLESKSRGTEPMYFEDLSNEQKIEVMKREFITILKSVFDNPESLKAYVTNKKLSREQAKQIFKNLHKLNMNKCPCCRKFDQKLLTTPIDRELEPLIDIAQSSAKSRSY